MASKDTRTDEEIVRFMYSMKDADGVFRIYDRRGRNSNYITKGRLKKLCDAGYVCVATLTSAHWSGTAWGNFPRNMDNRWEVSVTDTGKTFIGL